MARLRTLPHWDDPPQHWCFTTFLTGTPCVCEADRRLWQGKVLVATVQGAQRQVETRAFRRLTPRQRLVVYLALVAPRAVETLVLRQVAGLASTGRPDTPRLWGLLRSELAAGILQRTRRPDGLVEYAWGAGARAEDT